MVMAFGSLLFKCILIYIADGSQKRRIYCQCYGFMAARNDDLPGMISG